MCGGPRSHSRCHEGESGPPPSPPLKTGGGHHRTCTPSKWGRVNSRVKSAVGSLRVGDASDAAATAAFASALSSTRRRYFALRRRLKINRSRSGVGGSLGASRRGQPGRPPSHDWSLSLVGAVPPIGLFSPMSYCHCDWSILTGLLFTDWLVPFELLPL